MRVVLGERAVGEGGELIIGYPWFGFEHILIHCL